MDAQSHVNVVSVCFTAVLKGTCCKCIMRHSFITMWKGTTDFGWERRHPYNTIHIWSTGPDPINVFVAWALNWETVYHYYCFLFLQSVWRIHVFWWDVVTRWFSHPSIHGSVPPVNAVSLRRPALIIGWEVLHASFIGQIPKCFDHG